MLKYQVIKRECKFKVKFYSKAGAKFPWDQYSDKKLQMKQCNRITNT